MTRLQTFFTLFIIACLSVAAFAILYIQSFFAMAGHLNHYEPESINGFFYFFTPQIIIAAIIMAVANIAYRALGSWYIIKKTTLKDMEKTALVLGFVFFGFVTAIVFMLIAKNRNFIDN